MAEKLEKLNIVDLTAYLRGVESICKKYENEMFFNPASEKSFHKFGGIKEKIMKEIENRLSDLC